MRKLAIAMTELLRNSNREQNKEVLKKRINKNKQINKQINKKMNKITNKKVIFLIISLIITIIIINTNVKALSYLLTPRINDNSPTYTTDDLTCNWIPSNDATNQTIIWYKDGTEISRKTENGTLSQNDTILHNYTTKGEVWTCKVTIYNSTNNLTAYDNATIENSAPTTPTLWDHTKTNDLTETTIIVYEDQTYNYYLESTDSDNDTLKYYDTYSPPEFCTVTDQTTGEVTCQPTQEDLINNTNTTINLTFWASDEPSNPLEPKAAGNQFTFKIIPVNDAPIATLTNQTISVTETLNTTFPVSDEEGDTINATLNSTGTDPEIASDVSVTMADDNNIRVTYYTNPTDYNDVGNRTISITITDDKGGSRTESFILTIESVNRAPIITTPTNGTTYTINQDENIIIGLEATDPDANETTQTITFSTNYTRPTMIVNTTNPTVNATLNATGYINYTPRYDEIGNHTIIIIARDQEGSTNQTTIIIEVKNINDPPIIYNNSYYDNNTLNNQDLNNLTAYANSPFWYRINWTDYDYYLGDQITITDNTTLFNITNEGIISFTPEDTNVRTNPYNILITVTDASGSKAERNITLTIKNNTKPYFTSAFDLMNCTEKSICTYNLSAYATDDDLNDEVSSYEVRIINSTGYNSTPLNISYNRTTGIISFTPTQSEVSDYYLNITIYDKYGASNHQLLKTRINNYEDAPTLTRYDFGNETIVENKTFQYELRVTDEDLLLPDELYNETITITTNQSYATITTISVVNETVTAIITFTPNSSMIGNNSIRIKATDSAGLNNTHEVNFTVLPKTNPPVIKEFTPYASTNPDDELLFIEGYKNATTYSQNQGIIRIPENNTNITFGIIATDDYTPTNELTYEWFINNTPISENNTSLIIESTNNNKTIITFNFYSSGTYELKAVVNDTTLESNEWAWIINVTNVNQNPRLVNPLYDNITIDQTTTYVNYFKNFAGDNGTSEVKFYDPDDDINGDGVISGSETQTLTYTATDCNAADLEINGDDLTIVPKAVGQCYVVFTATDEDGASVESNTVNITVLSVPEGNNVAPQNPTGGGGGGSSTTPMPIPISNDVEVPKPLDLIAPEVATTYENRTIKIPIQVRNNWTEEIKGIKLSAELPEGPKYDNIEWWFDTDYIESLQTNQSTNTTLMITGYRLGENFEVKVIANSTSPSFQDEALVLFNSIEKGGDEKELEAKVTFARDLLSENSECQELAELLDKGNQLMKEGDITGAAKYVDAAINGCKYLISKVKPEEEKPSFLNPVFELNEETIKIITFSLLIIMLILGILFIAHYHYTEKKEDYDF